MVAGAQSEQVLEWQKVIQMLHVLVIHGIKVLVRIIGLYKYHFLFTLT